MALYTPEYQPTGEEIAVLNTSKGPIRVQLAGNDAPIHVGNFVELAQKGFYDGLKFHRYVPASSSRAAVPTPARRPRAGGRRPRSGHGSLRHRQPGLLHQGGVHHQPEQLPRGRRARHGPLHGSQLRQVRSSTCAWVPSTTWTPAIPCSARPSRARTSSASCAPAMSSSPSSSRTPRSSFAPRRARRAVSGPVSPRPNPRPARRPPNV